MTITETKRENTTVLVLEGRLDTNTAPSLESVLIPKLKAATGELQLDCAGLSYVSSAGLRVLLMGQKTALACKVQFALRQVLPEVMEVFQMTGFSDILTFV